MRKPIFLGPYLSFTPFAWVILSALSVMLGVAAYAGLQVAFQRNMVAAIRSADVLAEFCAREAGLGNAGCSVEHRQQPSDQLLWSFMVDAGLLDPRDVETPIDLANNTTAPPVIREMQRYLAGALGPVSNGPGRTGLELLQHAGQVCSGSNPDDAEQRNDRRTVIATFLAETYPERWRWSGRDYVFDDAVLLRTGVSEEEAISPRMLNYFARSYPWLGALRTSVARGVSDAEIASALLFASGSLQPQSSADGPVPSYAYAAPAAAGEPRAGPACQLRVDLLASDADRYQYLDARGQLILYLAGRIRTSEPAKAARFWMTLITGPEQMALIIVFVFGLLATLMRLIETLRLRDPRRGFVDAFAGRPVPALRAGETDRWDHIRGQMFRKIASARWPVKLAAALLPAIGFVGTVRGIMNSLSGADQIVWATSVNERSAAISALSSDLGLAFATTLIALLFGMALSVAMAIEGRVIDLMLLRRLDLAPEPAAAPAQAVP